MRRIYGNPPVDLGIIDLYPREMMFWLYCPIKLPGMMSVSAPDNLAQFKPIWDTVRTDAVAAWPHSYVYLTAKTIHVSKENPGNRPGWHSDGFMTDDINYIWSDCNGTLFWEPDTLVSFVEDHRASLAEMQEAADLGPHKAYPDRHLLRLDQTVIHRVADVDTPRVRTFVKVSVSRHKYDLIGNSINHELAPDWTYHERNEDRNSPSSQEGNQ